MVGEVLIPPEPSTQDPVETVVQDTALSQVGPTFPVKLLGGVVLDKRGGNDFAVTDSKQLDSTAAYVSSNSGPSRSNVSSCTHSRTENRMVSFVSARASYDVFGRERRVLLSSSHVLSESVYCKSLWQL